MKTKLKYIGLYLLIATLLSATLAFYLNVDMTFTVPLFIISILLMFIDDKYIDKFIDQFTPHPIKIDDDE